MPSIPPPLRDQHQVDASHLKLLAIFHFVFAGLAIAGIGMLFLQFTIMHALMTDPEFWRQAKGPPPPEFVVSIMRVLFGVMGGLFVIGAAANVISGMCLLQRRARVFSLIIAGLDCLNLPFGTVLGVFTFVVLLRPSVQELYAADRTA